MTRAVYEDVLSEYAGLESSLAAPAVPRDHLRARRLRRCLAELGPLHAAAVRLRTVEEDLAAAVELGWEAEAERLSAQATELRDDLAARLALRDPRDPFDVVVFVEGDARCVALLARRYRDLAEERGWSVQDLGGRPGPAAAFAITAREGAEGPWGALKHENGQCGGLLGDLPDEASARVTVVPEGLDVPDPPPQDLRLDLYCTRRPEHPPDVWVTHLPSGIQVRGTGTRSYEAKAAALRQIRALLAAGAPGPG
ncbi:PCRF domain-containing protein [Amycolatopsis sp. H6(2020)]|nr:PCRF domain-containing protein [Amycolatopsis sp. H6(2020)]